MSISNINNNKAGNDDVDVTAATNNNNNEEDITGNEMSISRQSVKINSSFHSYFTRVASSKLSQLSQPPLSHMVQERLSDTYGHQVDGDSSNNSNNNSTEWITIGGPTFQKDVFSRIYASSETCNALMWAINSSELNLQQNNNSINKELTNTMNEIVQEKQAICDILEYNEVTLHTATIHPLLVQNIKNLQ